MTCPLWDNYQRLWILSMCEQTRSMQTGPKREYVMAITADNQGTINCDEWWWTNLIFLLNFLNGITKQTHSVFESCLSQNPFIFPFILNNYFRCFGAKVQGVYSLLLPIFSCLFFQYYYCTFKNVACTFQPSSCFLIWFFLTLSRKPGKNLVIVLSFV